MRIAAVLVGLVAGAGCSVCTLVAHPTGVFIEVVDADGKALKPTSFTVRFDGQTVSCPESPEPTPPLDCVRWEQIFLEATPAKLHVTATGANDTRFEGEIEPKYVTTEMNGPGCGEETQAHERITLR